MPKGKRLKKSKGGGKGKKGIGKKKRRLRGRKGKKMVHSRLLINSVQTKLEIQMLKYRSCAEKYKEFIRRAENWMNSNRSMFFSLLKSCISYSAMNITYDDFKAGLSTMEAPFSKIEIHIITLLFDRNKDGFIEFGDLSGDLIGLSLSEGSLQEEKKDEISSNYRGWVRCHFHCLSVLKLSQHIFHFVEVVPLNTYTEGLVSIIRNHTQLTMPEIKLYLTSDENLESQLLPETMLTDMNLRGGSEWEPVDLDIYYRPAGEYTSAWPNSSLSELANLQSDPILWSKLITDNMVFDKLTGREMDKPDTHGCNQFDQFKVPKAKLIHDIRQTMSSLKI